MSEYNIDPGNAEEMRKYLITIAEKKKLSYDTISRKCYDQGQDVSKSTVAKFFTNPDLDLGYHKFMAISRAITGYDLQLREFTEPLPLPDTEKAEYMRELMETKKDRILYLEEQLRNEHAEHRQQLHDQREDFANRYDAINRDKRVWRGVALFVLFALFAFCLIDLIDTDSGWIQSSGIDGILHSGLIGGYFNG